MSDKKYVLSLDNLDLSLLSQFVHKPFNEKRLLWSKAFLDGESTYCQVNMISNELQDEGNYFVPSETYMCHVCNIEVPKIYYKQHTQSNMHYNYRRLIEKVLENLAKQIKVDIDTIDTEERNNQFYCETCSKVVLTEYKDKHNNSMYHLKALENQKLTDDFIELYFGNKETEVVNNPDKILESHNNVRGVGNSVKNIDNLLETDQITESTSIIVNKNCAPSFPINQVKTELSNFYVSSLSSDHESENSDSEYDFDVMKFSKQINNFQTYLKDMIERYNLQYKIPSVENNAIIIVTPKGFKEKISIHSFHGISDGIYCQLCGTWMISNIMEHIRTENHVRNILQPVNDDFTREVIQNHRWNHCLLCNIMVVKGSNHVALRHKQYGEGNAYTTIGLPTKSPNISNKTFCDVCNKNIDKRNYLSHTKSRKHKSKLKQQKNKREVVANNNSSSNKGNDKTFCDICNKNIDSHNFKSHTKGNKHKEELKIKLDKSSSVSIETNCAPTNMDKISNMMYCEICDISIHAHNMSSHVNSNKHKQTAKSNKSIVVVESNISTQKAVPVNEMYCDICKVKVPKGGMKIHEKGKSHKNKCINGKTLNQLKSELNKLDTPSSMTSNNSLPSTSKDMAINLVSHNHMNKITIEEKLIEYKKQMSNLCTNELECVVCQVRVPNKDKNIIEHVEAVKHATNMNSLLIVSKITKKSSKFFHCELCDSYINNFIDHINHDVNHIFKFLEFYKVQLNECVHDNLLETDALTCTYRRLHKIMLERNKIVRISKSYYQCRVCEIVLLSRQEIEHMLSLDHLHVLKSLNPS